MAIQLAHAADPYWIIALWKAVHGGDPAADTIARGVIASVEGYVQGAVVEEAAMKKMVEPLKRIGITVMEQNGKAGVQPEAHRISLGPGKTNNGVFRCFKFGNGDTICVPEIGDPAR